MSHNCTICQSSSSLKFRINGYEIFSCSRCGHEFLSSILTEEHVAKVYDDQYFFGGDAGYPDYLSEADILEEKAKEYSKILSRYTSRGSLLDVGCAAGFTLKGFTSEGWSGVGIEPNEGMAIFGRDQLGLDIRNTSLEQAQIVDSFDVVCLIQVIGHVFDLRQAISKVAEFTNSDGYCLVEYWDRTSWITRMIGKNWHEYSPPSVVHWFALSELIHLFGEFGYTKIAGGSPKKYILGSHVKSLLEYKIHSLGYGKKLSAGLNIIPDNMKFRYPPIDLKWVLFRKIMNVE